MSHSIDDITSVHALYKGSTGLDNTVVLGTGVAGVLVVLMILCLVVALVAIACIIRKDSKKTSSGGAGVFLLHVSVTYVR